jgi:hypothetical protein
MPAHHDPLFHPECGFLELKGQIFAQVGTALHAGTSSAAPSKSVSEELTEDVAQILECGWIESNPTTRRPNSGVPEAVV